MSDRSAIIIERAIGILIVAGALVVPWLVVARFRRSLAHRGGLTALSVMGALMVSMVGLIFGVCGYPGPPGVGAVPRAAKRRADAVVSALESYKSSENRYPSRLQDLVPADLSDTVLPRFLTVVPTGLDYQTDSAGHSFRLQFHYAGPGSNRCWRTDSSAIWQCSGLF